MKREHIEALTGRYETIWSLYDQASPPRTSSFPAGVGLMVLWIVLGAFAGVGVAAVTFLVFGAR